MDNYYDIHNNKNSWIEGYFNLDGIGEVVVMVRKRFINTTPTYRKRR